MDNKLKQQQLHLCIIIFIKIKNVVLPTILVNVSFCKTLNQHRERNNIFQYVHTKNKHENAVLHIAKTLYYVNGMS